LPAARRLRGATDLLDRHLRRGRWRHRDVPRSQSGFSVLTMNSSASPTVVACANSSQSRQHHGRQRKKV
jgi:hypothetical protein